MYKYILKNKVLFFFNIVLIILCASTEIVKAYLFKYLLDSATISTYDDFIYAVIYCIGFLIISFTIYILSDLVDIRITKKSLTNLKNNLFKSILKKDITTFNGNNTSKYISMFTNDINMLNVDFFENIKSLIYYITVFIMSFFGILSISYYFIISILVLGYIPVLISNLFMKKIASLKKDYSDKLYEFTNKLNDMMSGFEIIKSFNLEHFSNTKFSNINTDVEKANSNVKLIESLLSNINSICSLFLFLFNMLLGVYLIINKQITVGALIATVQLMNNIINPLGNLVEIKNKIKSINLIYKNIEDEINIKTTDQFDYVEKNIFCNKIQLKNVSFSYDKDKVILKDFSYTFLKNKKYAIVGSSGSGKSTLLKLISKYCVNYEGDIFIDDVNLKCLNYKNLNTLMSLINQNIYVFNDTIKNNICLNQTYLENKLSNTFKQSGLTEFVDNLPLKEDTMIEENGKNFSGGEKQRIAIARALIRDTPILLIDEATSALDNINRYNIEKAILNLPNITSICITHNINEELMKMYDEIIVLDKGSIVEVGKYTDLIAQNGYFSNLISQVPNNEAMSM